MNPNDSAETPKSNEVVEAAALFSDVYGELKRMALSKLAQEKPGFTLQATALVHEAYLRLLGSEDDVKFQNRAHFFGAAAEAMRRILIDAARRRLTQKRGGAPKRHELDEITIDTDADDTELIAVNDLVDRLAEIDPQAAQLVKLRFFAGLQMHEIASVLDISVRKAHDIWSYARAWLRKECS